MPLGFEPAQANLAVTAGPREIFKVLEENSGEEDSDIMFNEGSKVPALSRLVSQSFMEPSAFDFSNPNNLPFPEPPLARINVEKAQNLI